MNLNGDTGTALLIFDMHKSNIRNPAFYTKLLQHNILYKVIPGGQTCNLQPMDLYANGVISKKLKQKFNDYYTSKVLRWVNNGNDVANFKADFRWSLLKPFHARWILTTYYELPHDVMIKSFDLLHLNTINNNHDDDDVKTDT